MKISPVHMGLMIFGVIVIIVESVIIYRNMKTIQGKDRIIASFKSNLPV